MAYIFFEKTDENGKLDSQDELFLQTLEVEGVENTLIKLCGFHPEKDKYLLDELKIHYLRLKEKNLAKNLEF